VQLKDQIGLYLLQFAGFYIVLKEFRLAVEFCIWIKASGASVLSLVWLPMSGKFNIYKIQQPIVEDPSLVLQGQSLWVILKPILILPQILKELYEA
jgi:hypothetical protein